MPNNLKYPGEKKMARTLYCKAPLPSWKKNPRSLQLPPHLENTSQPSARVEKDDGSSSTCTKRTTSSTMPKCTSGGGDRTNKIK